MSDHQSFFPLNWSDKYLSREFMSSLSVNLYRIIEIETKESKQNSGKRETSL